MLDKLALLIGSIILCGLLVPAPIAAAQETSRLVDSGNRLGEVRLYLPGEGPDEVLFLISDKDGWTEALGETAQALSRGGALVAGIDLRRVLAHVADGETDCIYLVSDLEALSKRLQHELGRASYLSPFLVGMGAGGTLAYASLAQAPAATLAGVVVVDAGGSLGTSLPFCAGAPFTGRPGDYRYGPMDPLPGFLTMLDHPGHPHPWDWLGGERTLAVELAHGGQPLPAEIAAALKEAEAASGATAALADLPIIELPAAPTTPFLAVILSGDGGWRDLDKSIGEWLARHGVAVIGLDSLRYFWTPRSPERIASDLTRIMRHYMATWHRGKLVLVGYSFGAGVLPATVERLPPDVTAALVQVSLLGIARRADFAFHMAGWLGDVSDEAQPTAPDLARLAPSMVQCFYGEEEADSLCPDPVAAGTERVRTSGGHHFDGDYERLAGIILAGAIRRAGER